MKTAQHPKNKPFYGCHVIVHENKFQN